MIRESIREVLVHDFSSPSRKKSQLVVLLVVSRADLLLKDLRPDFRQVVMSAYPDGWREFVLHTPPDQTALLSKVSNSGPTISKLAIHAAPNLVSFPQFLKSILHGIWLFVKSEQDRRRAMTCDQQRSKSGPPVAKKIGRLVGCMQPPCPHNQREPDDFTARRTPYEC